MLEIEMKFPVPDFAPVREHLHKMSVIHKETRQDADYYFNAPDRDFARTDEAFRLRCIGARNFITYKGPKTDQQTKTRTEIEIPLGDGPEIAEKFQQMVQCLGYKFVAVVRKRREIFTLQRGDFALEICLDDVDGLGQFVELEIAGSQAEFAAAREVLQRTAGAMGLLQSERRSYLELLLSRTTGDQ